MNGRQFKTFKKCQKPILLTNNGKGKIRIKDVTLLFDKNGGLYDIRPRIGNVLNTYRGRTRAWVDDIAQELKWYLNK